MLTIRFGPTDLASVRFSVSPLIELWQSVRALQSPVAPALHSPWLADARARLHDVDFDELELELARLMARPPHGFARAPEEALGELSGVLRAYWQRVLAPHWERIHAALDGDVLCRARQAVSGGIQALLGDLDGSVRYEAGHLIIEKAWSGSLELRGRGLLLVPSVFVWPAVTIVDAGPSQPTLIYPARGSGLVWEPRGAPGQALAALIGSRRAAVLATLDVPCSTTSLAHRLDVSPGSVSQHLAVLYDAGLIERHRVGRVVLYQRSAAGNLLVDGHTPGLEAA